MFVLAPVLPDAIGSVDPIPPAGDPGVLGYLYVAIAVVLVVGTVVWLLLARYVRAGTDLREVARVWGLGRWPSRLLLLHGVVVALAYATLAPEPMVRTVTLVFVTGLGPIGLAVYNANRPALQAVAAAGESLSPGSSDPGDADGPVAVTGTVTAAAVEPGGAARADAGANEATSRPDRSPFGDVECVASQWAIRAERLGLPTTLHLGATPVSRFTLDTEDGPAYRVDPTDPELRFLTVRAKDRYHRTVHGHALDDQVSSFLAARSLPDRLDLVYAERTVDVGQRVTVVGSIRGGSEGAGGQTVVGPPPDGHLLVYDAGEETVREYLRTVRYGLPVGLASLAIGWGYLAWVAIL